eukprot:gene15522-17104_t
MERAILKKERIRQGHRSYVARVISQAEGVMEAKPVDMIRLKSLEIQLKERSKKLKEFDAEILDMISEDETLDAYCGEEIEETGRFEERITIALLSIDEVKSEVEKPKLTRSNSEISIDSLSSKNDGKDVAEVVSLYQDVKDRISKGGFHLRKWKSNHPIVTQKIECDEPNKKSPSGEMSYAKEVLGYENTQIGKNKALGITWDKTNDTIEIDLAKMTIQKGENKLFRITALVVKFIAKSRKQTTETSVTASETAAAETLWIKSAQCNLVKEEGHKQLKQQLGLFEDEEVLKCRGGLEN